jgi:K+-sensing histidine kinase KdpD
VPLSRISTDVTLPEVTCSELLVPIDLSHESWGVLPLAHSIARKLGLPVVPLFVDVSTSGSVAELEHPLVLRSAIAGEAVAVEVLPGGDVVSAIAKLADHRRFSVVAMSTRGATGPVDNAWDNVCGELLQARDASLLVVGPRFDAIDNADIRRVAVCIDAAAPDNAILRDALGWAQALDVPMVVVIVHGSRSSRPGADETYDVLAAVFENLPPARVSVTAEALHDVDVAAAIVRFANRRSGTLLALAPGAAVRAVHALTDSVTRRVVQDSCAPMLLRWHRPDSAT